MSNQPSAIQVQWENLAAEAREEANEKPAGRERDQLLKRADQFETSAHMEGWLNSSELRPPAGR
ncbi:MAG: hypothetical protein K2W78_11040 [Xanthobacteraceae bacterium]|nr:hypothetical protein [Xanthobacteraceae bacterium]